MRGLVSGADVSAAGPVACHPVPVLAALRAGSGAPAGATRRLAPARAVCVGVMVLALGSLAACGSDGGGAKVVDVASVSTVAARSDATTVSPGAKTVAVTTAVSATVAATTRVPAPTTAVPKTATTAATATATTTSVVASTATAAGVEYRSEAEGLSAVFPSKPDEGKLPIPLPNGGSIEAVLVQAKKGGAAYLLSSLVLPASRTASATPAEILADSQAGAVANTNGTVVSERDVDVFGNPGREFVARVTDNGLPGRYRSRIVLVGGKQIQLVYVAGEPDYSDADAEAFLTSLKLVN